MSNCSICGTLEHWHIAGKHEMAEAYCPKCQPKKVTILPLDEGSDFDIDERDIADLNKDLERLSKIPGYPVPLDANGMPVHSHSPPAISFNNDIDTRLSSSGPPISLAAGGSSTLKISNPPADFEIHGVDGKATTLSVDGSKVIVAYDELPETAAQGQMACIKGENITYVYDGEEWQNLGEALLGKKRSVLTPQDEKIDRRAAVAATKAKNEEL